MRYKSRRVLSFYLMLQTHYYHSITTYSSDSPRKLLSRFLLRMCQLYIQEWHVVMVNVRRKVEEEGQTGCCVCVEVIKRRLVVHPSIWLTVT